MFPKFVVVVTKHQPETPQALAVNTVLGTYYAETEADAHQVLLERVSQLRKENVPANSFGPGVPTVQGAIYARK